MRRKFISIALWKFRWNWCRCEMRYQCEWACAITVMALIYYIHMIRTKIDDTAMKKNCISFFFPRTKWRYAKDLLSFFVCVPNTWFYNKFYNNLFRPFDSMYSIHSLDQVCRIFLSVLPPTNEMHWTYKSITIKSNQINSTFRIFRIKPFCVYKKLCKQFA